MAVKHRTGHRTAIQAVYAPSPASSTAVPIRMATASMTLLSHRPLVTAIAETAYRARVAPVATDSGSR